MSVFLEEVKKLQRWNQWYGWILEACGRREGFTCLPQLLYPVTKSHKTTSAVEWQSTMDQLDVSTMGVWHQVSMPLQ
jgi:hypothetical protein